MVHGFLLLYNQKWELWGKCMLGNNANNNAKYLGAYENILPLVHIVHFKLFLINAMHE